jgi:tetratricopeptide (TPR) repeat protein
MPYNFQRRKEESEIIKRFENSIKNGSLSSYFSEEEFEMILELYIEKEQNRKVVAAADIGLNQYPYSTELRLSKAQALTNLQDFDNALKVLNEAETFQPMDEQVLSMQANLHSLKGNYLDAIRINKKLLNFTDNISEALFSIGMCYQCLADYQKAIEFYKRSLEEDQGNENALYELAYCLDLQGELKESISYYQQFIDSDPYSEYAWYNLGILYNKLNNYSEAISAYEFALAIDDSFSSAHFNMGNTYMNLEQFSKALDCYSRTQEIEGPSSELYCHIGAAYENLNQHELAIKYFRKAIKLDEMNHEGWFGVGVNLSYQQKWLEASHFLKRAIKLNNEDSAYWHALAETEAKVGNIVNSLEAYEEANFLDPENLDIYLDWSMLYYEQGDFDKAIALMQSAIEAVPHEALGYYRLVAYFIEAGRYKQAFSYLENALILNFQKHEVLYEFFPKLETQKALYKIIDQYRKRSH